jgi:hypothetical protein
VVVELRGGESLALEASDWLGFYRRPMPPREVRHKFDALVAGHMDDRRRDELADVVLHLESAHVADLTGLLAHAHPAA